MKNKCQVFFNRGCLSRCYRCCFNCFFAAWVASFYLHFRPSVYSFCPARVWASVCFSLVYLNTSPQFIQLLLFVQATSDLNRLLFKFRTETEAPLPVIKISKKTSQSVGGFPFLETKRNDINRSSTKRASNIRGRTGYKV